MNILGLLGGGGNNIMLQAFGAMMQGQSRNNSCKILLRITHSYLELTSQIFNKAKKIFTNLKVWT